MSLSKSKFTKGLQCHKALWLFENRRELQAPPDAAAISRMQAGDEVGLLAQQLFPGGREIVFDPKNFAGMLSQTAAYIDAGADTLYEASFSQDDVFVACDILHHTAAGWELYEVKSATRVKDYHRDDIAIQYYVLNRAGLKVCKACLIHINTGYVHNAELDIHSLFRIKDVTADTIARQSAIPDALQAMKTMLEGGEPDIAIGPQCSSPFDCNFRDYCWEEVPQQSVFNLYNLKGQRKFDLYHQGIVTLEQLPENMDLNATQRLQMTAHKTRAPVINRQVIESFLGQIESPVYYLDFETFAHAMPRFKQQRPYEKVPFQYSLHVDDGDHLIHTEFLADHHVDPRRTLAEKLLSDMGSEGTIIAYNMGFEKSVINKLAELYPDLSKSLRALTGRFIDLVVPFRQGGYYDSRMNGSFSIKAVLPALFPDDVQLSYKSLSIQDGNAASEIFANLYRNTNNEEVEQIRQALLKYCELDTLAMVKIVQFLKKQLISRG